MATGYKDGYRSLPPYFSCLELVSYLQTNIYVGYPYQDIYSAAEILLHLETDDNIIKPSSRIDTLYCLVNEGIEANDKDPELTDANNISLETSKCAVIDSHLFDNGRELMDRFYKHIKPNELFTKDSLAAYLSLNEFPHLEWLYSDKLAEQLLVSELDNSTIVIRLEGDGVTTIYSLFLGEVK